MTTLASAQNSSLFEERLQLKMIAFVLSKSTSAISGYIGGYSHARWTEWAKKLMGEGSKTKLAETHFLKRSNCYSIKMN